MYCDLWLHLWLVFRSGLYCAHTVVNKHFWKTNSLKLSHCKPIPCNENRGFTVKFSHREIPVIKTGVPEMRTGVRCNENRCGKLHRENPVLALYWPCTGLQWKNFVELQADKGRCNAFYV
jgi:hypothetical protein